MLSDVHIHVQGLDFHRGQRKIFDALDLAIPRGKVTAIMGPSGTGKTTLLKLIGSQLRPSGGRVLIGEQDVHRLRREQLFALRRNIGMLFQSGALLTDLTVFDNVAFPLRRHTRLPESLIRTLVLMRLHSVGLRNARSLMPAELSGGMARRVALARALVLDPDIIFYDEPFTGQDPISMQVLVSLIRNLNQALGLTSVIVSHDVAETLSIADYVYIIAAGKTVAQGTPAELRDDDSPWVRQFIDGKDDGVVPFHFAGKAYGDDLIASGDTESDHA